MPMLTLLLLNEALASPCVPLAARPLGARLGLWDLTEGRVGPAEELASTRRQEAVEQLTGLLRVPQIQPEQRTEMLLRYAGLVAEEGRYRARCDPASNKADTEPSAIGSFLTCGRGRRPCWDLVTGLDLVPRSRLAVDPFRDGDPPIR